MTNNHEKQDTLKISVLWKAYSVNQTFMKIMILYGIKERNQIQTIFVMSMLHLGLASHIRFFRTSGWTILLLTSRVVQYAPEWKKRYSD